MADDASSAPTIVIVGATGTGKSELALNIAERMIADGRVAEIVNADAMQLYRGMDIGTAKVPPTLRRRVPHHLLDVLDVLDEASVADYQPRARAAIDDIVRRGGVPILVGGSGLYVSSVIFDFAFPPRNQAVRDRLEAELLAQGPQALHIRLAATSPETARKIDPANGRRVVRALELVALDASGHGGALPEAPRLWRPAHLIGLRVRRDELVKRLDARVERMWSDGLVEEVHGLIPAGIEMSVTASRAIGYAQALAQLRSEVEETAAIADTQRLTRRYARRQVSWFARYRDLHWVEPGDPVDGVLDRL